jgi:rhodanese-related sulfurtransferase
VEWESVGSIIETGGLPRDRDIVVVCYVGQSSGQITGILRSVGYRAYSLLDGFLEWEAQGFPTDSEPD